MVTTMPSFPLHQVQQEAAAKKSQTERGTITGFTLYDFSLTQHAGEGGVHLNKALVASLEKVTLWREKVRVGILQ